MAKFIFINPRWNVARGNIWKTINSVTPPLGLAMLAAVLEADGHHADIIDAAALELDDGQILALLPRDATHVGITATTPEIDSAVQLARRIRIERPDLLILMGGVHASVMHEELVSAGICDLVVRGEGEEPVRQLAAGTDTAAIRGITWNNVGGVVINPDTEVYADLDTLPFPAYQKLPMHRYRSTLGAARRSPSIGIITSRGCPGACSFCYSGMFGDRVRFMSAERVLELMLLLKTDYGIREFSFYDDTFTASRGRVEQLCAWIIEQGHDFSWSCFARVDRVSPELLSLMKRAGCHQVSYGIESADEAILASMNKPMSRVMVENAVLWARAAGIDVRGLFMLGIVGETEESLKRNLSYALELDIQYAVFNIMTPFPGTSVHEWAAKAGVLKHRDWSRYDFAHVILNLETVSAQAVERIYGESYRRFYLRPGYLVDRIRRIRSLQELVLYLRIFYGIMKVSGSH